MRLMLLPVLLAAGAAYAQSQPASTSRAETGAAAQQRELANEPPPAATRSMPTAPSRPSSASSSGEALSTGPVANPGRDRAPSALAIDPRGGSWGNPVAPQVGTGLESVMNTGAPMGQSRMLRKVCPPGLENRDGNCVAPASGILR